MTELTPLEKLRAFQNAMRYTSFTVEEATAIINTPDSEILYGDTVPDMVTETVRRPTRREAASEGLEEGLTSADDNH
jgi:hypothetical protein